MEGAFECIREDVLPPGDEAAHLAAVAAKAGEHRASCVAWAEPVAGNAPQPAVTPWVAAAQAVRGRRDACLGPAR